MSPILIIGGVPIPHEAGDDLSQTYAPIGGAALVRMMSGAAVRQTHWRRLKTTISGSGRLPVPLAGIDFDQVLTVACVAPRQISAAVPSIVLPSARRNDVAPWGFAVLPSGVCVPTGVTLAGSTATLAAVAGALTYTVSYLPQLVVLADPPAEQYDARGAVTGWEFTAEEI